MNNNYSQTVDKTASERKQRVGDAPGFFPCRKVVPAFPIREFDLRITHAS